MLADVRQGQGDQTQACQKREGDSHDPLDNHIKDVSLRNKEDEEATGRDAQQQQPEQASIATTTTNKKHEPGRETREHRAKLVSARVKAAKAEKNINQITFCLVEAKKNLAESPLSLSIRIIRDPACPQNTDLITKKRVFLVFVVIT